MTKDVAVLCAHDQSMVSEQPVFNADDETVTRVERCFRAGELEAGTDVSIRDVMTEDIAVLGAHDQGFVRSRDKAIPHVKRCFGASKLEARANVAACNIMTKDVAVLSHTR